MKYTVEVKKMARTYVEVDAATKKEAAEKARKEASFGTDHLRTRLVHGDKGRR